MKNLTIKVQVTPEQSKAIQEAIFKKGGGWATGDTCLKYLDKPFLVINYGYLVYSVTEDEFYEYNDNAKPVCARDALAIINESTAIKRSPCPPLMIGIYKAVFAPDTK